MQSIRIEIETGNAAFSDDPGREVARVLEHLAERFARPDIDVGRHKLLDANGNTCGHVTVTN